MRDAAKFQRLETVCDAWAPAMDECVRRQCAVAEAQAYESGSMRAISTAIARSVLANTVRCGLQELSEREANPIDQVSERMRREGGGRKQQAKRDPGLYLYPSGIQVSDAELAAAERVPVAEVVQAAEIYVQAAVELGRTA
jgi:hypothetical protein